MQFALTGLGECNGSILTAIGQRYFSDLVLRRRPAPAAGDGTGYLLGSQAFLERVRGDDDAHVITPDPLHSPSPQMNWSAAHGAGWKSVLPVPAGTRPCSLFSPSEDSQSWRPSCDIARPQRSV